MTTVEHEHAAPTGLRLEEHDRAARNLVDLHRAADQAGRVRDEIPTRRAADVAASAALVFDLAVETFRVRFYGHRSGSQVVVSDTDVLVLTGNGHRHRQVWPRSAGER